jgi:hypothetical protein
MAELLNRDEQASLLREVAELRLLVQELRDLNQELQIDADNARRQARTFSRLLQTRRSR